MPTIYISQKSKIFNDISNKALDFNFRSSYIVL